MKNQFSLDIKKPCSENFNKFKRTKAGGLCDLCSQEVIDFTKMNSDEVLNYFNSINTNNTCGRFTSTQLKTFSQKPRSIFGINLLSGLTFSLLSLISIYSGQAQSILQDKTDSNQDPSKTDSKIQKNEIVVKGTVIDENGLPLPGVNIIQHGTRNGTQTNFDGEFEFPENLKKGDVLLFSFLGYDTKRLIISNGNIDSKIQMEVNMDPLELVVMGKVATKGVYKSKKK